MEGYGSAFFITCTQECHTQLMALSHFLATPSIFCDIPMIPSATCGEVSQGSNKKKELKQLLESSNAPLASFTAYAAAAAAWVSCYHIIRRLASGDPQGS